MADRRGADATHACVLWSETDVMYQAALATGNMQTGSALSPSAYIVSGTTHATHDVAVIVYAASYARSDMKRADDAKTAKVSALFFLLTGQHSKLVQLEKRTRPSAADGGA